MQHATKVGRNNIIVAATLFLYDRGNAISDLMRRLEQMSADAGVTAGEAEYFQVLKSPVRIWEYSPGGMAFLERTSLKDRTDFSQPAYHRILERFSRPRTRTSTCCSTAP